MDTKKFLLGTLAGGGTYFLLGWVMYELLLGSFFEANAGPVSGLMKEEPDFPWLVLGNIFSGAFITYIWLKWANIRSFGTGLQGGFIIGLLLGLGYNFIQLGVMNMGNMTAHLVDSVVAAVMLGITGGVVGAVLGMGSGD